MAETTYAPGDRVQWLDMPGYVTGTVKTITPTGVHVELDCGLRLDVGVDNVQGSLRRIATRGGA